MKKVMGAVSVVLLLTVNLVQAGDWNLAKNVRRLEQTAPDYKDDKAVDKKFLEVLDLTEKTKSGDALYEETKRIASMPALASSKYLDSLQYLMLVRSITEMKAGIGEQDYWLNQLKQNDKSPHLLAAWLVHMRQMRKDSPALRVDAQALVDWIKLQKADKRVRAPEYTRSLLLEYKPRADFIEGDWPKVYKLSYYKAMIIPPEGFLEEDAYVLMLDRIKQGRDDVLAEMAAIYKKSGKRNEASDVLYQQATLKIAMKDYKAAKPMLDEAAKLNPENKNAVMERDRIKLELAYQSLEPQEPVETPAPVPSDQAPASDLQGAAANEQRAVPVQQE